jgi:tetratricopeptide (TPR) repeat protein
MVTLGRVSWIASPAWAAEAAQTESVSEADLTYFYKAPSPGRAARLVAYFDSLRAADKQGSRPPLMGFFAAVFQHYPADIDKMLRSNAQQHVFVRQVLQQYVAGHPSEPATKAIVTLDREYGYYQLGNLVSVTQAGPGKNSVTVNINYFTQLVEDLERHAARYPPQFEFADDRQRAQRDITAISKMLDPLTDNFSKNPQMLLRLALLHAAGHNLDIPDSAPKAIADFNKLLSLTPDDPQANYRYGSFLAATTRKGEGIPLLQKAKRLDVPEADYWLGLSYQLVGDKAKAIESLETYTKHAPNDRQAAVLLQAIRDDKLTITTAKPEGAP